MDEDDEAPAEENARKQIPEGIPDALEGLKLLFTGTFDAMDRDTSKATALKYGAKVVTKLDLADYIILGVKAGPKKLEEIEQKGLETLDEDGFFALLEEGVPQEKRDRMAEKADAQPAKKKQKK